MQRIFMDTYITSEPKLQSELDLAEGVAEWRKMQTSSILPECSNFPVNLPGSFVFPQANEPRMPQVRLREIGERTLGDRQRPQ